MVCNGIASDWRPTYLSIRLSADLWKPTYVEPHVCGTPCVWNPMCVEPHACGSPCLWNPGRMESHVRGTCVRNPTCVEPHVCGTPRAWNLMRAEPHVWANPGGSPTGTRTGAAQGQGPQQPPILALGLKTPTQGLQRFPEVSGVLWASPGGLGGPSGGFRGRPESSPRPKQGKRRRRKR